MWIITIRSPDGEPQEYILKPGVNTIGRKLSNDIIISDSSASRNHAEIYFDVDDNNVTITDLDSTNGTFLNRHNITGIVPLINRDVIRIGTCLLSIHYMTAESDPMERRKAGTRPLTRDMVIESFDSNAVLLYVLNSRWDLLQRTARDGVFGGIQRGLPERAGYHRRCHRS